MKTIVFKRATHFSIIWGISLAILTLIEWNSLGRNPVEQEILSPFIQRTMTVTLEDTPKVDFDGFTDEKEEAPDAALRYDVEFHFNGPFFLACFFIPIIIFNGLGILWERMRGQ